MTAACARSITFKIPGTAKSPGLQVLATEVDGSIEFSLDVLGGTGLTADLQGLFFNFNDSLKLGGLHATGTMVTGFDTVDVIDLGNGANMHGASSPFDVGVRFGTQGIGIDDIHSTSFTLSGASPLTLDDIAQVQFGARLTSVGSADGARKDSAKLVVTAPAAPDAHDDAYSIFEDGQQDLASPSHTPAATLFEVLANDTDADGDTLTVSMVDAPLHGTAVIADGADADLLAGDAILYTPDADYSGPDTFEYCISDANGGTDFAFANVDIAAVADEPSLTYEILAGASVGEIIVRTTADQTDADSSEFIDRLALSGLPSGVTVNMTEYDPADEPDRIVQDFVLTLPLGTDTKFDLAIEAVSKETSNGDEQSASVVIPIELDYTANDFNQTFVAVDQSMWGAGEQFVFDNDAFLGVEESVGPTSGGGLLYYEFEAYLKAGFESKLHFEGGEIDANLPYDISINTNYNKTTDMMVIDSGAVLGGGGFTTQGPQGTYALDFIFNYLLDAAVGIDLPSPAPDYEIVGLEAGSNNTFNILDLNSDNLGYELPLPAGFSIDFAWPNIETTSDSTNVYESTGSSNNFVQLNLDVDELLFALLGLPDPLGGSASFLGGAVYANYDLIDLDLNAGLNFLQDFAMSVEGLPGTLTFEDGSTQAFVFGSDITLVDASLKDANHDENIDFTLTLDPDVALSNSTDLGFNVGYDFLIGRFAAGYDLSIDLGLFDVDLGSGSVEIGPLYEAGGTLPVATVGVYDSTFDLDFDSQTVTFKA